MVQKFFLKQSTKENKSPREENKIKIFLNEGDEQNQNQMAPKCTQVK